MDREIDWYAVRSRRSSSPVYKLGEVIDEQVIVADQPLTFQYYLNKGTVANPKN